MALIVCGECAGQVADTATSCPTCGARTPAALARTEQWRNVLRVLVLCLLLVFAIAVVKGSIG